MDKEQGQQQTVFAKYVLWRENMKRVKDVILVGVILVLAVMAFGCAPVGKQDISELEEAIGELRQEVGELREREMEQTNTSAAGTSIPAAEPTATQAQPQEGTMVSGTGFEERIKEAEQTANAVIAEVGNDGTAGGYAERMNLYLENRQKLKEAEQQLDRIEWELESAYTQGNIAIEAYMEMERLVEGIEDRLDHAEDGLELKLGIDD